MQFRAKQIAPPKEWGTFEDLCHALFKQVWEDPLAQKNGRRGQAQCGVDIFGSLNGGSESYWGVQCKGKDSNYGSKAEWSEVLTEIAKAEKFSPKLDKWIFATTAPADATLQNAARDTCFGFRIGSSYQQTVQRTNCLFHSRCWFRSETQCTNFRQKGNTKSYHN